MYFSHCCTNITNPRPSLSSLLSPPLLSLSTLPFFPHSVLQLRLASSEEGRVLDSLSSFTARLNLSCLTKFHKGIEKEAETVAKQRETRCEPDGIYDIFVQKVS